MIIANIDISSRIGIDEVKQICALCTDVSSLSLIVKTLTNPDKRTADNAAWILTHMPQSTLQQLQPHLHHLIDIALTTDSTTKQRLLLNVILCLTFDEENLRSDFLDFCLNIITDTRFPPGIRSLCMKLAFAQCRLFPELLNELRNIHQIMEYDLLEPAMKAVYKNIGKKLQQLNN